MVWGKVVNFISGKFILSFVILPSKFKGFRKWPIWSLVTNTVYYYYYFFFFHFLLLSLYARIFFSLSLTSCSLSLISETLMADHPSNSIFEHHCHHRRWFCSSTVNLSQHHHKDGLSSLISLFSLKPETKNHLLPIRFSFPQNPKPTLRSISYKGS